MSKIYEAENICQTYNGIAALKIDQFSLEKGASLVLLGANGSGKSTFLRLLAFLEKPASGILRYFGGKEPRKECTLLLQEAWLLHESVFRNVVLGLRMRGIHKNLDEIFQQAMHAVGFTQPEIFARRKPGTLSGGEKQRIALASRLAINPTVLLLDEPTAYVDRKSGECIANALQEQQAKGMTIVCATHDMNLAKALHAEKMEMVRP